MRHCAMHCLPERARARACISVVGSAFDERAAPMSRLNQSFPLVFLSQGASALHDFVRQLLGVELCMTDLARGMRVSGNEADTAACRKFIVVKG